MSEPGSTRAMWSKDPTQNRDLGAVGAFVLQTLLPWWGINPPGVKERRTM